MAIERADLDAAEPPKPPEPPADVYPPCPTWLANRVDSNGDRAVRTREALIELGVPPRSIFWADTQGKGSGDVYVRLVRFTKPGQKAILEALFRTAWQHDLVGFAIHQHAILIGRIPKYNQTARLVAIEALDDYLRLVDWLASPQKPPPPATRLVPGAARDDQSPDAEGLAGVIRALGAMATWLGRQAPLAVAQLPSDDLALLRDATLRLHAVRGLAARLVWRGGRPRVLPPSLRPVNPRIYQ